MISKVKSFIDDYKVLLRSVPAFITSFFIVTTILMNLAASKIIFNACGVAVTGGFILSWAPFLAMDVVTKRFGARAAIMLNILSALGNLFAVIFLAIVAAIPTPGADYSQFNYIYGSVWFIVLCSTVAFVASGVVNSLINAVIGKLFKNKTSVAEFISRSFVSTFIGQAIDNFLFIGGVYMIFAPIYWNTSLPFKTCIGTAIMGGLFELLAEVVISPIGYHTVKRWEKEHVGQEYIDLHSADKEN